MHEPGTARSPGSMGSIQILADAVADSVHDMVRPMVFPHQNEAIRIIVIAHPADSLGIFRRLEMDYAGTAEFLFNFIFRIGRHGLRKLKKKARFQRASGEEIPVVPGYLACNPAIQRPQHFLNFFPLPQVQGSLRPTFFSSLTNCFTGAMRPSSKYHRPLTFLKEAISWWIFRLSFSV